MADTSMLDQPSTPDQASRGKRFGPIAAAFLSAGIGGVVLGVLVVLNEASSAIHDALELTTAVGPLSGKTLFAVIAWLVAWGILHAVLRDSDPEPRKVFIWTGVMFAIAVALTFPPLFLSFAAE